MAVRYSDARLETSADTRRVCHLALHEAQLAEFEADEDVRALSPQVLALYEQVLSIAWGFAAKAFEVHPYPRLPPPPAQQANEADDESDSSSWSSSSSRSASPPRIVAQACAEQLHGGQGTRRPPPVDLADPHGC